MENKKYVYKPILRIRHSKNKLDKLRMLERKIIETCKKGIKKCGTFDSKQIGWINGYRELVAGSDMDPNEYFPGIDLSKFDGFGMFSFSNEFFTKTDIKDPMILIGLRSEFNVTMLGYIMVFWTDLIEQLTDGSKDFYVSFEMMKFVQESTD